MGDQEITETRNCIPKFCFRNYGNVEKLYPQVYASWGDYTTPQYCEKNQLATGFIFEWEPMQGSDDDTAGNGFYMYCNAKNDHTRGSKKKIGGSGDWPKASQYFDCQNGYYLYGIQLNSEGFQGEGLGGDSDDTSLNNVRMWCRNQSMALNTHYNNQMLQHGEDGPHVLIAQSIMEWWVFNFKS